jgi:hypothetical protein
MPMNSSSEDSTSELQKASTSEPASNSHVRSVAQMIKDLENIREAADEIWVDNVTGAADASDPTPTHASVIMKLAELLIKSLKARGES